MVLIRQGIVLDASKRDTAGRGRGLEATLRSGTRWVKDELSAIDNS